MTDKFTLDMVSIRLITEKKLYSDLVISSPENAVELLGKELASFDREAVAIINLTSSAKPINAHIASIGTLNSASISPREVFKASILSNAAAFLIMHNHPSGSLKPSQEDYNMTGNLIIASNIMGIPLFDHIIVGFNNGTLDYHSFRANNEFDYSVSLFKKSVGSQYLFEDSSRKNNAPTPKSLSEVFAKYKNKEPRNERGNKTHL